MTCDGMRTVPIKTIPVPTRDEFARDYLSGLGEPVIIRGAVEHWPARSKWSFAYFREKYGKDFGRAHLDFGSGLGCKLTRVETYIDNLDQPFDRITGFTVDEYNRPIPVEPEYDPAGTWNFTWESISQYPELAADIRPALPFIPDLLEPMGPRVRGLIEMVVQKKDTAIYLSRRNTITPLHQDYGYSHSRLIQIQGEKQAVLFSPEDSPWVYGGAFDPESPDLSQLPLLANATARTGIFTPGDVLFIPSNWWHYTRSLDHSITLSYNFFNEANLAQFIESMITSIPDFAVLKGVPNESLGKMKKALANIAETSL